MARLGSVCCGCGLARQALVRSVGVWFGAVGCGKAIGGVSEQEQRNSNGNW